MPYKASGYHRITYRMELTYFSLDRPQRVQIKKVSSKEDTHYIRSTNHELLGPHGAALSADSNHRIQTCRLEGRNQAGKDSNNQRQRHSPDNIIGR